MAASLCTYRSVLGFFPSRAKDFLREDRIFGSNKLVSFLKSLYSNPKKQLPKVNECMITSDPALAMVILTLQDNEENFYLRKKCAEAYKKKFPEDEKFQTIYAYLKNPAALIAHFLIVGGHWKCANLNYTDDYYEEQLRGIFDGTIAFVENGDVITPEELEEIIKTNRDFESNVEFFGNKYVVKNWCSTFNTTDPLILISRLFIKARLEMQEKMWGEYNAFVEEFHKFSDVILDHYGIEKTKRIVVCVIAQGQEIDIDHLQRLIVSNFGLKALYYTLPLSTRLIKRKEHESAKDTFFETMLLKRHAISLLMKDVRAFIVLSNSVDEFIFDKFLNLYLSKGKDQIIIEEIASINFPPGSATVTAEDLESRIKRILSFMKPDVPAFSKVRYILSCQVDGSLERVSVAHRHPDGKLVIDNADLSTRLAIKTDGKLVIDDADLSTQLTIKKEATKQFTLVVRCSLIASIAIFLLNWTNLSFYHSTLRHLTNFSISAM